MSMSLWFCHLVVSIDSIFNPTHMTREGRNGESLLQIIEAAHWTLKVRSSAQMTQYTCCLNVGLPDFHSDAFLFMTVY